MAPTFTHMATQAATQEVRMAKSLNFGSFQQLKKELLSQRAGPLVSPVEDIADDMFCGHMDDEFESLWDKADKDDEE